VLQRCTGFPIKDWLTAEEMLRIATRNGATAMLKGESIGAIEKGKKADLVLFNLHSLSFTPMNNVVNHLIYCATPQAVDSVIVDGAVLMQRGQLTTIDKYKIMEEARLAWGEIKIRNRALYDFAENVIEYM
jgi:5-methylthioadenosine/S-adenosylhomocysteine deaminase